MSQGMDADAVGRLAERYKALTPQERRHYNEAQTRKDFIDPLFASLGWDVRGVKRNEVDVETHVSGGRADYAFKIDGVVRFYLEAKKLEEDLYNPEYAKQVITYAYNKGVPWAVLCNFARLQVFNAEWETDDLNRARFLDLAWEDYAAADSPVWLVSREAFLGGELDRRAQTYGGMRPRQPVEKSLYAQMRHWRERLFNDIARMRPELTFEQVDEVIERLLNRLIFIRNCEDRRVEAADLRAALHQWQRPGRRAGLTEGVRTIFANFDATFDSDLFAFHLVDQLLASGTELEDALGEIVAGLYSPPRSLAAYDFAVIDGDVLGQVYEQYLGHVAQVVKEVAAKRGSQLALGIEVPQIQLEAKRERRKERGIYYTPKWVVDYIVRETVGRYLEEHTYNDVLNVKILDPACGSGSFLIRAFDVLLEHHGRVRSKAAGELDQYERLPILTANIFGVDLDHRAVDFARLNLLLRAVARRELLPSLERNIVRGNSLISGSEEELRPYFGEGWREKQPFDWQREFPGIMGQGGFDIIIGNPPYVRIQTLDREEADYYRERFETAHGAFDLYVLFIEQGLHLLRDGGRLGFITSGKFLKSEYGKKLCQHISSTAEVQALVELSAHSDVFGEATSYPVIVVLRKGKGMQPFRYTFVPSGVEVATGKALAALAGADGRDVRQSALTEGVWPPPTGEAEALMRKMDAAGPRLGDLADRVFQGLVTSADRVYTLLLRGISDSGEVRVYSRATGKEHVIESTLLKQLVDGKAIRRFWATLGEERLLFPYRVSEGRAALIPAEEFTADYPLTWQYLSENRSTLEGRERGKMRHERWYGYVYPKNLSLHSRPKLAIPRLVYDLEAAYDASGVWYLDNVDVGGLILKEPTDTNYKFVLGLLNSRLLDFYFRQISAPFRGDYRSANRQFIAPLPIKRVDPSNPAESKLHDGLVALVERMLALHERLAAGGGVQDEERGQIEREIERTDREIDELVYDLYGLTQEERRLVEEEVGRQGRTRAGRGRVAGGGG